MRKYCFLLTTFVLVIIFISVNKLSKKEVQLSHALATFAIEELKHRNAHLIGQKNKLKEISKFRYNENLNEILGIYEDETFDFLSINNTLESNSSSLDTAILILEEISKDFQQSKKYKFDFISTVDSVILDKELQRLPCVKTILKSVEINADKLILEIEDLEQDSNYFSKNHHWVRINQDKYNVDSFPMKLKLDVNNLEYEILRNSKS